MYVRTCRLMYTLSCCLLILSSFSIPIGTASQRSEAKNKMIDLVQGILQFWTTVTAVKCQRYISHLDIVLPEIIRVQGEATGF